MQSDKLSCLALMCNASMNHHRKTLLQSKAQQEQEKLGCCAFS